MNPIRVAIASDHAGYDLKQWLYETLSEPTPENREVTFTDLGTHSRAPIDYPELAIALGRVIQKGEADRGILICGSGVGVTITANKLAGIRACLCHDSYSAHQGVEHDGMNVLALGAWVVSTRLAKELISIFIQARFSNEERHLRRMRQIAALEKDWPKATTGNSFYAPHL